MKNVLKFHLLVMVIAIIIVLLTMFIINRDYNNIYQDMKNSFLEITSQQLTSQLSYVENNFNNYFVLQNKNPDEFLKLFKNKAIVYDKNKYLGNPDGIKIAKIISRNLDLLKNKGNIECEKTFYFYNKKLYIVLIHKDEKNTYFLTSNINDMIDKINSKSTNIKFFLTEEPEHMDSIKIAQEDDRKIYVDYKNLSNSLIIVANATGMVLITFFLISIIMTYISQKDRLRFQKMLKNSSISDIIKKDIKIRGFSGELFKIIKELSDEIEFQNKELMSSNNLANRKKEIVEKLLSQDPEKYFDLSYPEFFNELLRFVLKILPHGEKGSVVMVNKNGDYKFVAMKGYNIELYKSLKLKKDQLFINFENTKKSIIIKDPLKKVDQKDRDQSHMNAYGNLWELKETLAAPIVVQGSIRAIIYVDIFSEDQHFDQEDLDLIDYFVAYTGSFLHNKLYYDKIIELSNIDELTKAYNRRYFEKIIYKEISRAERYKYKDGILYFDLNDFKKINDTYGHKVGDKALIKFANYMKENLRKSDIFARFGGDEFIAMLPFMEKEELLKKIKRLKSDKIYFQHKGEKIQITYSVGYSIIPDDGKTIDEALIKADMRMYEEKIKTHNSRNINS